MRPSSLTAKLSRYFCIKSNSVNGNVAVISDIFRNFTWKKLKIITLELARDGYIGGSLWSYKLSMILTNNQLPIKWISLRRWVHPFRQGAQQAHIPRHTDRLRHSRLPWWGDCSAIYRCHWCGEYHPSEGVCGVLGALICIAMIENILLLPLLYHKDVYKQKSKRKKIKFRLTNGLLSCKTSHKDM